MNLLIPSQWSILLLKDTFMLASWARCHTKPLLFGPGCEEYSLWTRQVQTLNMVLIPLTPSKHWNLTHPLSLLPQLLQPLQGSDAQLGPFVTILNHSLLLSLDVINYNARLGHHFWQAGKMSSCKMIHYFSSHHVTFGFWASSQLDNIILHASNKKADQSLSDFETGNCPAAHATLDKEQLIFLIKTALVDTVTSLQGSDGEAVSVSEMHKLLTKIHYIVDSAVFNGLVMQLVFEYIF